MFFVLDAWGEHGNVGSWGNHDIARKECIVEIMSEDYATLDGALNVTSTGIMDVVRVGEPQYAEVTRKREECTGWCKKKLEVMGV